MDRHKGMHYRINRAKRALRKEVRYRGITLETRRLCTEKEESTREKRKTIAAHKLGREAVSARRIRRNLLSVVSMKGRTVHGDSRQLTEIGQQGRENVSNI